MTECPPTTTSKPKSRRRLILLLLLAAGSLVLLSESTTTSKVEGHACLLLSLLLLLQDRGSWQMAVVVTRLLASNDMTGCTLAPLSRRSSLSLVLCDVCAISSKPTSAEREDSECQDGGVDGVQSQWTSKRVTRIEWQRASVCGSVCARSA